MRRPDPATGLRFAAVSLILCTANICAVARRSSYALLLDDEEDGGGGGDGSASFSFFPQTQPRGLVYGFYDESCPDAEGIVSSTMRELYLANPNVAAALVRLFFHDCFIHGCDASVLLDRINGDKSEREAAPNQSLRGFGAVDKIKARLEAACPRTVSCADILVLAARDSLVLAGGPSYPVLTGRSDSARAFYDEVGARIPSPNATYTVTLDAFARRGFTERETVALLGAHSIGKVHCRFFKDRIDNFAGTGEPDDTIDADMVEEMRAVCDGDGAAPMEMGYYRQGREVGFGAHYYAKLLGGRGILRSDQQLTAGSTVRWVRVYAAGERGEEVFREDFAHAMVKLAALEPLTGSPGHVRIRCSKPSYSYSNWENQFCKASTVHGAVSGGCASSILSPQDIHVGLGAEPPSRPNSFTSTSSCMAPSPLYGRAVTKLLGKANAVSPRQERHLSDPFPRHAEARRAAGRDGEARCGSISPCRAGCWRAV
uniref:peroxidase n=1 Tax=Oryza barthii TaxID=65489 RepID=A0A0D3ET80_9ORYZ